MSIKSMITPWMLAATLIMLIFHATETGAADWSVNSNGYTLYCDINVKDDANGQWKIFEARFSLPADTLAELWYECWDGGGRTPLMEPAYDFFCKVKDEQPGSSLYISRAPDEIHIYNNDLVPGYITPTFACKTVAKAAQVEVKKGGK